MTDTQKIIGITVVVAFICLIISVFVPLVKNSIPTVEAVAHTDSMYVQPSIEESKAWLACVNDAENIYSSVCRSQFPTAFNAYVNYYK